MDHDQIGHMKRIEASELDANCLQLMEEVSATGEPAVITKDGRPMCLLSPIRDRTTPLFGRHRGCAGDSR